MDAPNAADDDLLQQSDHEGFSDELNGHFRVRVRSISVPNRPTRNGGFENCNANGVDSSTNRAHADQSARKKVIVKVNSVTQPGQHVLRKARKFSSISAKYERRRQKMEGIKHKGLDDLQSMLRSLPHGMQEERSVIQRRIQELRETPASDTSDTAKPMTRPATSMALVKLDLPLPQENGQSALRRSTSGSGTTVRCSRKFGASPADIKNALLTWCQQRTANYKNISITNFSSAWADGLAFCALVHRHFPDAFNYSELTTNSRKRNFELAFSTAEERADVWPLLEVDDMLMMGQKPDWKCVFTYVQSLYKALKDVE